MRSYRTAPVQQGSSELSRRGKAVEAGMKGFWYTYANIFRLLEELQLPEWPLTDFTTSGFWSPRGLVTEAPVFSKLPRLPTLLGQFVHTAPLHWSLSLADRLTMLPFLAAFMDFNSSEEVYKKYDAISAYELFRLAGVSRAAYQEFLRPTLLVGLFAPPEDISAAAMLETLYFYALAHQAGGAGCGRQAGMTEGNDFDVCWCKGSIAELIFTPLVRRIEAQGGQVLGNRLVTGLVSGGGGGTGGLQEVTAVEAVDRTTGAVTVYPADAVVFAVGVNAMQRLVSSSSLLAQQEDFRAIMNLRSLDVIATRLFFDRIVPTRFPANVLSGFEPAAGCTYFNLNSLQDEYRDAAGTVITSDFYNASALLPLSDEAIVERVHQHLITCEPAFREAKVLDSVVLRYPKAVTHFSPGCYTYRPQQATSLPNVFMAGDWVKGLNHGANGLSQGRSRPVSKSKDIDPFRKGRFTCNEDYEKREAQVLRRVVQACSSCPSWICVPWRQSAGSQSAAVSRAVFPGRSRQPLVDVTRDVAQARQEGVQERAYVTGLTAANLVISRLGQGQPAHILNVEPDEPHVAAAKEVVKQLRGLPAALGLSSPLL
ncbi:hypothetical protein QJQ45_005136 [Haematococcus lacustris]|nr:hypothetical protein QJQ45_005136 [Haematococcus lacustris]